MASLTKLEQRRKIKFRIRKSVSGTAVKPRLTVFRSNAEMYAQLINDENGTTIASASTKEKAIANKGTKSEQSKLVGQTIAKAAQALNIDTCVFDRNGYLYHGRVKAVAEGAREGGLKF
jgi:large subunit ribosomal protein L18